MELEIYTERFRKIVFHVFNLFLFHPCGRAKRACHLHKKDISPQSEDKERSKEKREISPFSSKCKQHAFYANDIRKNWHSGRLKSSEINLNCRFSSGGCWLRIFLFLKMVKISIFMLKKTKTPGKMWKTLNTKFDHKINGSSFTQTTASAGWGSTLHNCSFEEGLAEMCWQGRFPSRIIEPNR